MAEIYDEQQELYQYVSRFKFDLMTLWLPATNATNSGRKLL
jgi:hypothetical protein